MSYRFTNTEKWQDTWFSNLSQIEMLLFIYLCDNCDIAGFIEVNWKRWAADLGSSKETLQGACKGLARGLIFSKEDNCIFLKNFLKHQKNLPLNESNKAHLGIIKRFDIYLDKFEYQSIEDLLQGACKGLQSPTGNGNGIGNDNGNTWKSNFEIYLEGLRSAYKEFINDKKLIEEHQKFNLNLDIPLTIEKSCKTFWATEGGWKNKKQAKIKDIDWKRTFINSLSQSQNKVYKQSNKSEQKPNTATMQNY